jgi:predicted DNA binding protein
LLRQVSLKLESETGVQEVAREHNATITVLDCKDIDKKDMAFLLDISSPSRNAEDVIADLKAKDIFKKVYAGETEGRPSRSLCVAVLSRPGICQAVLDCGAFCLNCPYSTREGEGDGKWKLLIRDSEQLKALLGELDDHGVKASIGGMSEARHEDRLTSRQTEILAKAISLGYFEFPRRFSLTDLSKQVGIKPSTLSQVLRAAEEKVMAKYAVEIGISKVSCAPKELFTSGETGSCAQRESNPYHNPSPNKLGANAKRISGA